MGAAPSLSASVRISSHMDLIAAQTGRSRNELVGIFLEYALDHCEIEEGTRNES